MHADELRSVPKQTPALSSSARKTTVELGRGLATDEESCLPTHRAMHCLSLAMQTRHPQRQVCPAVKDIHNMPIASK